MREVIDLAGQRFGRLVVIAKWHGNKQKYLNWICECDCGEYIIINGNNLRYGHTQSCGCLRRKATALRAWKHGFSDTRLYNIWRSFRRRCNNENNSDYHRYGGRGIKICKEWDKFVDFRDWAETNGYNDNLYIDRKDNSKGYFPWNCRFTTRKINSQNTRCSRRWYLNDMIFQTAKEAAEYFKVSPITIYRWCLGRKDQNKSPKNGCFAPKLY